MPRKHLPEDVELIIQISQGNEDALDVFSRMYEKYSRGIAYNYLAQHPGVTLEVDALYSVALEAAFLMLERYEDNPKISFFAYWRMIVEHNFNKVLLKHLGFYGKNPNAHILYSDEIGNQEYQNNPVSYIGDEAIVNDEFLSYVIERIKEGERGIRMVYLQLKGVDLLTISLLYHTSLSNVKRLISISKERLKKSFFNK